MFSSDPVSRLSTQITRWPCAEQVVAEVGAEEPGAAGDDRGWHRGHRTGGPQTEQPRRDAAAIRRRSAVPATAPWLGRPRSAPARRGDADHGIASTPTWRARRGCGGSRRASRAGRRPPPCVASASRPTLPPAARPRRRIRQRAARRPKAAPRGCLRVPRLAGDALPRPLQRREPREFSQRRGRAVPYAGRGDRRDKPHHVVADAVVLDGEIPVHGAHRRIVVGEIPTELGHADRATGREPGEVVGLEQRVRLGRHPAVAAEKVVDVEGASAGQRVDRGAAFRDDNVGVRERRGNVVTLVRRTDVPPRPRRAAPRPCQWSRPGSDSCRARRRATAANAATPAGRAVRGRRAPVTGAPEPWRCTPPPGARTAPAGRPRRSTTPSICGGDWKS